MNCKINLKQNVSEKEKIFWNMMGSLANALSTMCLLIVVNRVCGESDGGIFSIGHAVAQLMLTVGTFEVRNYQSTDMVDKYRFSDYFGFRIISCWVMMLVSVIYIFISGYTANKAIIAFLLCAYRAIDAFSDVFQGLFQQRNRIDISGKMLFLKVFYSSLAFVIMLVFTKNLIISTIIMDVVAFLWLGIYDIRVTKIITVIKCSFEFSTLKGILIECFPLFIGTFLTMYIVNEPKYAIDAYLSVQKQNVFGIIFMPAFVVNLFSLFVFRPMITTMAIAWEKKNNSDFLKLLSKALVWCVVFTIGGVVGAFLLGIPILEILYGINLKEYKLALMIIMIGGGGNAVSTVLRYTLTVVREQYKTLIAYVVALVVALFFAPMLITHYDIVGASILYACSMLVMTIVLVIILGMKVLKNR